MMNDDVKLACAQAARVQDGRQKGGRGTGMVSSSRKEGQDVWSTRQIPLLEGEPGGHSRAFIK